MDSRSLQNLLSTREAAEVSGYNPDYIGKLCRTGVLPGKRIGRSWFVEEDSFKKFVAKQKEENERRAQELAKERVKEYRQHQKVIEKTNKTLAKSEKTTQEQAVSVQVPANNPLEEKSVPSPYVPIDTFFAKGVAVSMTLLALSSGLALGYSGASSKTLALAIHDVQETGRLASNVFSTDAVETLRVAHAELGERLFESLQSGLHTYNNALVVSGTALRTADLSEVQRVATTLEQQFSRAYEPVLVAYLITLEDVGDETLRAGTLVRDTLQRDYALDALPSITDAQIAFGNALITTSNSFITSHEAGVRGWVAVSEEVPSRVVATVYGIGDALSTGTLYAPRTIATSYTQATYALGAPTADATLALLNTGTEIRNTLARLLDTESTNTLAAAVEGDVFNPATSIYKGGRSTALYTYTTINNLFRKTGSSIASLFAPQEVAVDTTPSIPVPTTTPDTTPTVSRPSHSIASGTTVFQNITNQFITNGVTFEYLEQRLRETRSSILDRRSVTRTTTGSGTGSVTSVTASGGSTGLSFTGGPITSSGTLTLGGTLAIGSGGTGIATAPAYGEVLLGDGSGGYVLTATSSLGITGGGGGGGVTSLAQTYGSAQTGAITLATSTAATFNGLTISNSITNSGGTFTFAPNSITGTLDNAGLTNSSVSYGGVSLSLGGSDATPAFNLADATGLPISTGVSGLGTGVAAALGINIGSAGAPVLFNGALGTPSSGTLTNATGLPIVGGTTGTLTVARGGTNQTTYTTGDLLYASAADTLSKLGIGTGGYILAVSNGVPAWVATSSINNGVSSVQQTYGSAQTGAITLATSTAATFNGLTISNSITNSGGTFTFAPNSITGTLDNAGLTNSSVSYGGVSLSLGGSDATPAFNLADATGLPISTGVSGLGTGVAAALGINIGSAGAPVLFNGALGTPSSGTLTNATGLPIVGGTTGTLTVARGGTGTTTAPVSQVLYGGADGTYQSIATTSVTIGSGLSYSGTFGAVLGGAAGTLTLNATGDWTGTFDGQEGTYYLARANHTGTQLASTISDFSSAVASYINSSSTIPHTGGSAYGDILSWTGSAWETRATSTLNVALSDTTGTLGQTQGGTGFSSYTAGDIIYADLSGDLQKLGLGSAGQVLKVQGGLPAWGADLTTGGGGGATAWATTSDSLAIYPSDTSDVLIIGNSATSTANSILEVFGRSYFSDRLGIGTTSPWRTLSVTGNSDLGVNALAGTFTSTSTTAINTFPNLSATNATTTALGINSETFTDLTGTGLSNVGGALTLNATGDWTGTFDGQEGTYYLARANHTGTQLASTISDFSSAVASYINASTTIWNDTTESSLEAFLTDVTNVFTNNDGALDDDDLTDNSLEDLSDVATMTKNYGDLLFWNGTAWSDIATSSLGLPTASITAIGPAGQTADGPTVTFATSTGSFNGLTTALTITGSGDTLTYTPSITGTLDNAGLTNSSVSYGGVSVSLGSSDATPAFNLADATGLPISTGVSGLGTGVATALGINIGSAGAPVLFNGALGTPSSGTLTNATGLPIVGGTTGTLTVARGGTGTTTLPVGQVLYGGSGSVYQSVATTSVTIGSGLSYSGTFGSVLGGAAGTLSLNTSGDWTGTFDGQEGTYYLARANHTGTQLASTISDFSSTARGLFSSTATGLTYTSGTGVFSLTSGYTIPLTASTTEWDTAFSWGDHSTVGYATFGYPFPSNATSTHLTFSGGASTTQLTTTGSTYLATSGGNVGIGTTTPDEKLDVYGNIRVLASSVGLGIFGKSSDASHRFSLTRQSFTGGGAGDFSISAFNGIGLTGGKTSGAENTTPHVYITNTGTVGIGTTSPQALFHVNRHDSAATAFLASRSGAAPSGFGIDFNSGYTRVGSVSDYRLFTGMTVDGAFTSSTERFTVLSANGNVGIGTTTPAAKLSISNYSSGASTAPLFIVASSTGSGATSTPFLINSLGQTAIGTSTISGTSHALTVGGVLHINNGSNWAPIQGASFQGIMTTGSYYFGKTFDSGNSGVLSYDDTGGYFKIFNNDSGTDNGVKVEDNLWISGDLRVTGTGLHTFSAGNVGIGTTSPYAKLSVVGETVAANFTATTTGTNTFPNANISKLVNLTSNGLVTTGSGDGTLSVTVPGTGVLTALGTNVGTAGAFVVNGGALGTPSSGTLTNATGLPISTGVSGLGSNVATFLGTPSSANLAAALTDESGAAGVFPRFSLSGQAYGDVTIWNGTNWVNVATSTLGLPTSAITAIGPTGQTQTGPTVTIATSTSVANGVTSAITVTGSGNTLTLTPSVSGTLDNSGLTNSSVSYGGVSLSLGGSDATPAFNLVDATGLPISTGVSGLGTGVATALGTNVGSAGAFVTFNGALGTPSSGTLTNATGLPIVGGTTGTLTVARGGTGTTTLPVGQVLYGGTGSVYQSVATSSATLGTGLSYSGTLGAFVGGAGGTLSIATSSLYTGTTGQVPYFSGTNTLIGTSTIFVTAAQDVGIGTNGPANYGAGYTTLAVNDSTTGVIDWLSGGFRYGTAYNASGNFLIGNYEAGDLQLLTDNTARVYVKSSTGNVGIGTSSPYAKLSVVGEVVGANFTATTTGTNTLPNTNITRLVNLTSNGLVTTGSGDGTLSVTVPGTGVLTALGVNVGTAGAFVVNGGALGTPSSGTLTNATGLPISTGVSGLGSNVATFLGTPSSANLAAALTDESGAAGVFPRFSLSGQAYGDVTIWNGTNWVNVATSTLGLPTSAITAIGPTGQTQTGPTVTIATSTSVANGVTSAITVTGSGNTLTLTPSVSGTLDNSGLTNSSVSYGGVSLSLGGSDATPAFNLVDATGLPISTGVSGLGTGVATALGTNVGSAGAFVTFNGALGTPSSGTLTNATGLPIVGGTTGTLTVARGGTGTTTLPVGQVLYGGTGSVYQSVATTSVTIGSGLSYSGTFGSVLGGAAGTLSLNTSGDWTGTLDSIEGASFLRSDTSDSYTSGTLTFDSGTGLDLNTTSLTIADTDIGFDGASTNFAFTGDFTANSDDLNIVKSTGYVGVGTTSPYRNFTVQGSVNTDLAVFASTNTSGPGLRFEGNGTYDGRIWRLLAGGSGNTGLLGAAGNFGIVDGTANAARIVIDSSGNVGIGTTTPGSRLSITGIANFTAATTTLYGTGGINIAGGCFAINGTCVGGSGGSGTVNTGIAGYFTYYPSTGTTVDDQSILYTDGTYLGVGTAAPRTRLQTLSTTSVASMTLGNPTGVGLTVSAAGDTAYGTNFGSFSNGTGWIQQGRLDGTATAYNLSLQASGGNVGIGTTTPHSKLHVASTGDVFAQFTNDTTGHASSDGLIVGHYSGNAQAYLINQEASTLVLGTSNTGRALFDSAGNFGVGDLSPAALFTVGNGDLFQVNSSGAIAAATGITSSGTITLSGTIDLGTNLGGVRLDSYNLNANTSGTSYNTIIRQDSAPTSASTLVNVALQAHAQHHSSATQGISGLTGLYAITTNGDTTTVATSKGLEVALGTNSGTITNTYGLYIGDITNGTQTNTPFSVYASDANADNYFAGNTYVGGLPTYPSKLTVIGAAGEVVSTPYGNSLLTLSNAGESGLSIHGASGSTSYIFFGTTGAGGNTAGRIAYNNNSTLASASMAFFTANAERLRIAGDGNIGIGTTSPYRKLSITDAVATAQVAISYDTANYTTFLTNSTGDLTIDAEGGYISALDEVLFICAGGACPSGAPSSGSIVAETSIGIASSTPWSGLAVASGKAITVAENTLATTTSISVDWRNGNQQLIRLGTAGTTISFSGYIEGQKLVLTVCNPGATAGAISWGTQVLWAGGTAPTQTTTANKCDVWSFLATNATSSLKIFGTQSANF